ncbi:MAG TPA: bifunctional diaminohydroxyphosphoribosylaminopyrimidine deaminase/5-amino-6-(5-phosphoribosylamino)uracil reductase RibD, partial [Rhizomicrobium sp.]|nr:bifunctional diaminohydroxyphosphoribosylaminopyrimidine deaminase/5-amino-6-(5-phosphoribosylamino)uracil reductase RibD [Rhizomicrobium sp.]
RHALTLAGRALGQVAPNPAVGCVIVRDGVVVGRGWTQKGGRPHAETMALREAGEGARGAAAYVTLEPCAHHGQTPPCANALIEAGIARVVAAIEDPDPRVAGKGFAMLRAANVDVTADVLKDEAAELNAGFFLRLKENRPLVTLKIAESADGFIAKPSGESKWITGEDARRFAHLLRARHDAILVGIGTVLADDPELTCRLPGLEDRSPMRVVLDTHLRLSPQSKLAQTAHQIPTLVFTAAEGGEALQKLGVEIVRTSTDPQGRPDAHAVLAELARRGLTRLLVEGGAMVHAGFDKWADRLEIFRGPANLGVGLRSAVNPQLNRFTHVATRCLGPDLLESYIAKA